MPGRKRETTPSLEKFTVVPQDGGTFRLHIETDDGETLEVAATRDQLDVMADALDDILADSEEGDEAVKD